MTGTDVDARVVSGFINATTQAAQFDAVPPECNTEEFGRT